MKRVCIHPKDAAMLIGINERDAQKLLRTIRSALNKQKHQYVTVKEFAAYTGISEELISLQ